LLVLSRKQEQSVMIGQDVKITVLEIKGSHVRLGITAPETIKVMREEINNNI